MSYNPVDGYYTYTLEWWAFDDSVVTMIFGEMEGFVSGMVHDTIEEAKAWVREFIRSIHEIMDALEVSDD